MPDMWGLASIATTFATYLGVLTSVGTVFTASLFQLTGYRRFAIVFATLGIAATVLGFSLAGAALTGDAAGMTDPEMLGLLWSTPVGTTFVLRVLGLGVLCVGLFTGRFGLVLSLVGAAIALWSFVTVGHISNRDSVVLNLILMFHLAAVSVWIGILAPLRTRSLDKARALEAADLGDRFGTMAAVFVPLLIFAGGYLGYALVGSLPNLFGTAYGQFLILKVVFVAGLLALAAANKLRFVPKMATGDRRAATHLAKSISLEWTMIVLILFATSVLTSAVTLPT